MITISYTRNGASVIPYREFNEEELASIKLKPITSELTNATDIIYYQGDEPKEEIIEPIKIREIASWKVKSILKIDGLFDTTGLALEQLDEPMKTMGQMAWQHAESFNQFSPTVQMIKAACQLTDEQLNDIFNRAEQINI